ncbi:GNAT family N-acetyltransferase [Rufibacter immobilis]|uniref:GNAT family N-acetyltransferase n=1 Tax=Rufibacter immobilis TaxID=1348778 RepID=UPI0035E9FE2A
MIQIETDRLLIRPLTETQLHLYVANNGSLEKQLGVGYSPKEIAEDLADALENYFLRLVPQHREQYYFYTLWSIILKQGQVLVGDLCFKGEPDEEGEVEIGYGTYADFQQQGIMTEAVGGLLRWCSTRPDIKTLIAETEAGNEASEKVLERNHFHRDAQTRDNTWWKCYIKDFKAADQAKTEQPLRVG